MNSSHDWSSTNSVKFSSVSSFFIGNVSTINQQRHTDRDTRKIEIAVSRIFFCSLYLASSSFSSGESSFSSSLSLIYLLIIFFGKALFINFNILAFGHGFGAANHLLRPLNSSISTSSISSIGLYCKDENLQSHCSHTFDVHFFSCSSMPFTS